MVKLRIQMKNNNKNPPSPSNHKPFSWPIRNQHSYRWREHIHSNRWKSPSIISDSSVPLAGERASWFYHSLTFLLGGANPRSKRFGWFNADEELFSVEHKGQETKRHTHTQAHKKTHSEVYPEAHWPDHNNGGKLMAMSEDLGFTTPFVLPLEAPFQIKKKS